MATPNFAPSNAFVNPLLTDLYQLTMAYAYWKAGKQDQPAAFDLFFRKNPFKGEFTVFAGLEECLRFVNTFKFSAEQIGFLQKSFPDWDDGFFTYLAGVDASKIRILAVKEGSVVFPRIPLLRVEGPLAPCQLLETTLLTLVNYPSLIATNAARHRFAVSADQSLLEFGLRRAQGPDGAMSASRYSYLGGFDATSNVQAAIKYGIPMKGTHAHAFVSSFRSLEELPSRTIRKPDSQDEVDFVGLVLEKLELLGNAQTNKGELAAFVAYAQAYPSGCLCLIDTYETLKSGVINFLAVALALHEIGYKPVGVRLDSGDLAYLSRECRAKFAAVSQQHGVPFEKLTIVASNDLDEKVLYSLKEQGHSIDAFGIGTNLVTCKSQPALGCVYKLVEISGEPRIKVSQDIVKVTIPGRKAAYRLYNNQNQPIMDLLVLEGNDMPKAGHKILARHPFDERKRAYVTPSAVEPLHELVWDGSLVNEQRSLKQKRDFCIQQCSTMREDHRRILNPTPYMVSVTPDLFTFTHNLWFEEVPITEIQ